jgi:ankyrin repeat protein
MHLAALNGHRDIVRLFQDYGVDMNIAVDLSNQLFAKSVLRHLCESSHGGVQEEDFQCIIEHHGDHFTPLSAAILRDPYGTSFRWLIDMGAILPQWALYQGSCSKNIDLVSAALQCGMSPNVRGWEPDGPTTLHSALTPRARLDIEGREACMRCANILIENGAHLGNSEVAQANLLGDGAYFTRLCNIQEANNSHSSGDLYNPEAICAAIFKDQEDVNLDFVRQVLQKRDTENEVLQAETSAICMAAWLGNCPILDLLLSKLPASQFISLKKNSLLGDLVAMDHSNKSLISIFTNCSAWKTNKTIEISPLCFSLYSQEALSLLLRHGYKPDRLTLSAAVSFGFDIVNTLVRGGEILESPLPDRVLSPICHAIVHSDFEAIKMLSEAGEDINSGHWWMDNALACAAKLGDIEAACLLIDLGADCNPPLEFSPLLYAAGEGNIEVAKLLIANGADVNFTSECNQSPLWAAAEAGKIDFLQLLLSNGAETEGNCRRSYMDAVLIARCKGHATVEKVLKEHREWTDEDRSLYEEMRTNGFFREADIQFDSLAEPHGMNRGDLPSSSAAIGLWGWSDEDFEDLVNFDYEGDLII